MLRECFESLFKTDYENFRVILVDNGSHDNLSEFARSYEGRVTLIRSDVNLGFVAGSNLALRQVRTDYVVLLNDDVIVDPDWLAELVSEAERDSAIGACQPKLRSLRNPRFFEYNGACGGMLDVYGVPFTRGRIFDLAEEDKGQYDKPVEIFWASGAALFLRVSVIREIGLLDEMFYAHMEEIDFCWRMKLSGYKVLSVPKSVIYHLGGGTSLPEKFYLKQRNNLITIVKNYSGWSLLRFLPLRIVQDFLSFTYYLIKKETRQARAIPVLRAYSWLLKNIRRVLSQRYTVQRRRKVKDKCIIHTMVKKSVSVQSYLLNRRYFSQLSGLPLELRCYMTTNSNAMSGGLVS
jgi:GT2 family glycosyltransferase